MMHLYTQLIRNLFYVFLLISSYSAHALTCPDIQTTINEIKQLTTLTAPIKLDKGYYYSGTVTLNKATINYYALQQPTAVTPTLQIKLLAPALMAGKLLNVDGNQLRCVYLGEMQDVNTPLFSMPWNQVIMTTTPLPPAALPLTITQISSNAEAGALYSLDISFQTANVAIKNWSLGFSMPRTFEQLVKPAENININPELQLQLCNTDTAQCVPMQLLKTDSPHLTTGTTSIFAPTDRSFELAGGSNYRLQLHHTNQWAPANFTAMPQSFFAIENDIIMPLTDPAEQQYKITGYDATQVANNIAAHQQTLWDNSIPNTESNLADKYHLVPTPNSIVLTSNQLFKFPSQGSITISSDFANDPNIPILKNYLQTRLHLDLIEQTKNPTIRIKKIALDNPEAYVLTISSAGLAIDASTNAGVFYAMQTATQLLWYSLNIPYVKITDAPRFKYRGILLDVSRHFFTVTEIKKLLDVMAAQKLNTLHLHLSDDEAWRIDVSETSSDPLLPLVALGAQRGFTQHSVLAPEFMPQANLDISNYALDGSLLEPNYIKANDLYNGYYTADDIKTIVDYANKQQITVIPEIDLPGHSRALVHSLPDIFIDKNDQSQFVSVQGYTDDVIPVCLYTGTSAQAKNFTDTINVTINRLNDLFANQSTVYYQKEVSVGGDEVASTAWSDDSSCQGIWQGLTALKKSQYFFSLLPTHINPMYLSGWQQIVQQDDGTLSDNILPANKLAHVWVWQPSGATTDQQGIKAAATLINNNYPTVLAFADNTYFDLTYTPDIWQPGYYWAGAYLDTNAALQAAANATRVENLVNANALENLVGLEGTLWTENIPNFNHLMYMALPKMTGLAEASWASSSTTNVNGKVNWQSLAYRLGSDNHDFLGFLNLTQGVIYRGYPFGISRELPEKIT